MLCRCDWPRFFLMPYRVIFVPTLRPTRLSGSSTMDAKVKQEWIDALVSGFYKQGKYQLREQGDFYDPCGVLCELAVNAGIIEPASFTPKSKHSLPDRSWSGYKYGSDGVTGLPAAVQEWAGVPYYIGMRISRMGDLGKNFEFIAQHIKEHL